MYVGYVTEKLDTVYNLPTIRQMLSVLFYNIRRLNKTIDESANLTIKECLLFWKNAQIPTQKEDKCVAKLKSEYTKWLALKKNAVLIY